ncbi:MAG: histidine phosphatase family protein [Elusimicrobia bacterium]|nr:histidine phosphatase family protein [Elusimicrobiota bacterium]
MRIYLLRHGQSLSALEAKVKKDADRPLSDQGRRDVERMARFLVDRGAAPGLILHSPLKRATQTAGEAARAWEAPPPLEAFTPLSNELGPEDLLAAIRKRSTGLAEVLAVGHQPQLGEFAQFLTGESFALRPGGLIALETSDSGARKLWSFNPEDLP